MKYERECHQRDILQTRLFQMEKELANRQQQSKLLGQLQIDIKRLHVAFDALEVRQRIPAVVRSLLSPLLLQAENTQLNAQLSLARPTSVQLHKFRHGTVHPSLAFILHLSRFCTDIPHSCHESLC